MTNIHRLAPEGATAAGKPKIEVGYATIDVTEGRHELRKRVAAKGERVRVLIVGYLEGSLAVGNDDGTSREFVMVVEHAREIELDAKPF